MATKKNMSGQCFGKAVIFTLLPRQRTNPKILI